MVKRYRKKDPYRKREAERYEQPVPSREFIMQYLEEIVRPVTIKHLLEAFAIENEEEKEGLRRRLKAMERDAQVIKNRRGSYALVKKMELVPGRVEGHKEGYGFLIPDDGSSDIFLSARQMRAVFPGDRVLVRVSNESYQKRREGIIVEVLERNTHHVVGRYYEEGGIAFIDPDKKEIAQDIIIPVGQQGNAHHGQFVVAEIVSQPIMRRQPMGRVIEVLGDHLTPGMEVELAIRSHELPFIWPDVVIDETKALPINVTESVIKKRRDLRHFPFVTIDGEDARDFDDAVYCESRENNKGWRLFVAIADVTHYVNPDTALDTEARLRGNSVYFPSRVIPMLPEKLSTNLCSLKPNLDRLAVVCEMTLDNKGEVSRYRFDEAVIRSHARMTYNEVADLLNEKEKNKHISLLPHLKQFHALYKKLLKQRRIRGAIEFETVETQILFGKGGKIKRIVPLQRNDAHRMIEEAMLLTNVMAAKYLEREKINVLYRNHEGPDSQKLEALRDFLKAFGLRLSGGDNPSSMDYAKLLKRIEKRPDLHLLQTVLLRSLRQAMYSPNNVGHFGLNYERYCHFTSPIRRYPDMIIHRALKHLLNHKKPSTFTYDNRAMEELGHHCSFTERRADEATRDAVVWLKCEYMLNKVGQVFDGIISGVTGFGVFVELENIFVEGLVHITSLANDYYHFDATHHLLRGKYTGKVYRLGDPIRVLVARVNLDEREIDFELTGLPK